MGYGTGGVSVGFSFKQLALTAFVSAVAAGWVGAAGVWLYEKPDRDVFLQIKQVMPTKDVSMSEIIARLSLNSETSKKLDALFKAAVNPAVTSDLNVKKGRAVMLEAFILESLKQPDPVKWMQTVIDNAPYAVNNFFEIEKYKNLPDEAKAYLNSYYSDIPEAVKIIKSIKELGITDFSEDDYLYSARMFYVIKNHKAGSLVNLPAVDFFANFIIWFMKSNTRAYVVEDLMAANFESALKNIQIMKKEDQKK